MSVNTYSNQVFVQYTFPNDHPVLRYYGVISIATGPCSRRYHCSHNHPCCCRRANPWSDRLLSSIVCRHYRDAPRRLVQSPTIRRPPLPSNLPQLQRRSVQRSPSFGGGIPPRGLPAAGRRGSPAEGWMERGRKLTPRPESGQAAPTRVLPLSMEPELTTPRV